MRLNDFIQYKYELTEYDNNRYGMKLPLDDYDNTYVSIGFTRNDDGTVHMEAPIISYKNGADGYAFSILYDEETLRQFYEEDEKYTIEGKHYIEIQHTSITDNSLIVEILNWTDKQLKVVPNYKVYEIDGDKEILITSVEGDEDTINGKSYSIKSVKLEEGKKFEKGKKYIVKYGKNSWGYFYDEIEFVR